VELKGDGVVVVIMHPGIVKVLRLSVFPSAGHNTDRRLDDSHTKLGRIEELCGARRSSE